MIQNKESSCCDSHSCGFHSNNFPPAFLSALHYNHLQKMWRLTIGAISFLIILVSIPGNLTIVHYLNEKPPGHQTTVDSVFKDFFLINFTSTLLNGLRYCFLLLYAFYNLPRKTAPSPSATHLLSLTQHPAVVRYYIKNLKIILFQFQRILDIKV